MTDTPPGFLSLLRRPGPPRTPPDPNWEARRRENEARYWAEHLDELVSFLPGIRRRRGDQRTERLVRDVVSAVRAREGDDQAVFARDRLRDRWREAGRRP